METIIRVWFDWQVLQLKRQCAVYMGVEAVQISSNNDIRIGDVSLWCMT